MAEVELMVESYNNKIKRELLFKADMDNRNTINLVSRLAGLFNKDAKPIEFNELYEHLLDVEDEKPSNKSNSVLTQKEEAEMIKQQMMFMQFASNHNKKFERNK